LERNFGKLISLPRLDIRISEICQKHCRKLVPNVLELNDIRTVQNLTPPGRLAIYGLVVKTNKNEVSVFLRTQSGLDTFLVESSFLRSQKNILLWKHCFSEITTNRRNFSSFESSRLGFNT